MHGETYIILTTIHTVRTPHALHATSGRSAHQPISLQALIILDMLCELAEGIPSSRALRAT